MHTGGRSSELSQENGSCGFVPASMVEFTFYFLDIMSVHGGGVHCSRSLVGCSLQLINM